MTLYNADVLKIAGASIKDSLKWTGWKWLVTGSIGALINVFKAGKDFFKVDNIWLSALYGLIGLVLIFLIRFFFVFCVNFLKYYHDKYRNTHYGDAIILLKDTFAQVHAYRKKQDNGHQDEDFMRTMLLFCNNLKEIFDNTTKSACSISIKVPLGDNTVHEKTVLVNLTRDVSHQERDTQKYIDIQHTILGNTAFSYSLNKVMTNDSKKFYVNNNINESENYINTSKTCYKDGKLPYNSELVFPIVPLVQINHKNYDCCGFICVDSEKKNTFTSKYEIAIVEGVADGIYDIIYERNKFKNRNNE
ncbi:MAG: hypothetical protein QM541_01345 [Flavobacterium sp.]|nr:hypothetical protein [Flavobacterium sp.]